MTLQLTVKRLTKRRTIAMRRTIIPVEKLFAWGKLNGVEFNKIDVKSDITSKDGATKGAGLFSTCQRSLNDHGAVLLSVPQDLVLSREQVDRYAGIDKHLKSVLDAADAFGKVSASILDVDVLFWFPSTRLYRHT